MSCPVESHLKSKCGVSAVGPTALATSASTPLPINGEKTAASVIRTTRASSTTGPSTATEHTCPSS